MKKTLISLLAICMCVSMLSACGNADTPSTEPSTTDAPTETTAAPTTVPVTEPPIQWETRTVYLCVSRTMTQHDGSGSGTVEFEYDEYGNQIRQWSVGYPGDRSGRSTVYSYDDKGNMLSSVSVDAEGAVGSRYEYTYDAAGNILSELYINQEGIISAEEYFTYNEDGWLIQKTDTAYYYDPALTIEYVVEYSADYASATIRKTNNGEPSGYTLETYDAAGRVVRTENYAKDGSWKSTITYAYDTQGKILLEEHFSSNELQADYNVIYTYNENDCLTSMDADYYYGYIMEFVYEPFEILVPVEG